LFESWLLGKLCEQTYLQGVKMTPLGILVLNQILLSVEPPFFISIRNIGRWTHMRLNDWNDKS